MTVHDITGGAPGTLLEEYAYDGNGNRQKALSNCPGAVPLDTEFPSGIRCPGPSGDTAADDQDRLCEYGGFTYSYNAHGQLQSKTDGAATTTYTYDGLGRLLGVSEPGMDIHYIHDALGRRIGKVRDGNLEKGWLHADAVNPIAELDGAGNVRATFIYGTRAHVPDAMVMTDGTVYRFITDHLGSVRLVVNAATGEVVQRMDYDAFGRVLSDTNPGFQPFGFAGGLHDDDTGLVRFGARDYDAYAGRWTAKDPILFGGGDENLYAYVVNDPVNLLDPIGLAGYDHFDTSHDGIVQGLADFGTGVADAASLGLGPLARALLDKNWGTNVSAGVDPCSKLYRAGTWASLIIGGGRSAYALGAKAQSLGRAATMESAFMASSTRNSLRKAFRAFIPGGGKTWSETLTKYGPDPAAIIRASGRTNPAYTAPGANLTIGGGVGAAQQPSPW